MPTLFDMLNTAQGGQGMDLLARQFNLSRQQAELAVEALTPAFSQGLKQNASDPYGIAGFMQALASGNHARYFEDAQNAFSPQGVAEGNGILGHLFGSKDVSRAVAAQAAQATGLGQDMLKQMLPVIASMIMGGLFKQSTNQFQGASAGGGNPLGQIIEQMMKQGGLGGLGGMAGATPQRGAPEPQSPFDNPLGKMLEGMFGQVAAGGSGRPAPRGQNPFGADNPFGKMFEEMLGGGQRAAPGSDDPPPRGRQPEPNPSGRPRNPYDDLFGDMFESGRKTRDDYQKGVESIFEQFTKGMDRRR
ncbi:MAG: DUF937 domain-containing protein [Rhizobiaceae bacterium]|nr:DUF937 domain-containing protein [Rhizobiaceae bacterium]